MFLPEQVHMIVLSISTAQINMCTHHFISDSYAFPATYLFTRLFSDSSLYQSTVAASLLVLDGLDISVGLDPS